MKSWPVQDAKSRFSEFLRASLTEGPQVVTLRRLAPAVGLGREVDNAAFRREKALTPLPHPFAQFSPISI